MLSSMWWYSQTNVIVHRTMLLSIWCFLRHHMRWYVLTPFEVVFLDTICGGILRHQLDSILKHHLRWYS